MTEQYLGNNKGKEIRAEYRIKFFPDKLPMIPMFQALSYDDDRYIEMLENAIQRGTPVNDEDYKKYFPIQKGVLY